MPRLLHVLPLIVNYWWPRIMCVKVVMVMVLLFLQLHVALLIATHSKIILLARQMWLLFWDNLLAVLLLRGYWLMRLGLDRL
jgi:hypothetical protein